MNVNITPKKDKQKSFVLPSVKISPVKVPSGAKQIGNYILGKTIGSGTFGKVHLGLHITTGQRVAVKIIDKLKINSKDLERIHREAEILKKILHPSLIQLYEIIETEKSLLFVTQYMQNGQLFNYIIQKQKLSEDEACKIFHQIIDGVQYLHSIGVAHRDLKPENILIDYDGRVKIIDFGLSNFYQKNQKLKTQCGSPCYAAPEMIEGKHRYDPILIDIWSAGIVLFAMITGYLPFCDPDTSKLYKKILAGSFKFPSWVSEDAKDLIQKMLVVNSSKRATLSQIVQHPWFTKLGIKKAVGIDSRFQKIPYQQSIVHNIESMGLKSSNLVESIEMNLKTKETALYYILAKKLVKQGHIVSSFFGCEHFNRDLVSSSQYIEDSNVQSTFIEVETVNPIPVDSDISAPETGSGVQLYTVKSVAFQSKLKQFLNQPSVIEDSKTAIMKDRFYANNLQNKKKKQNLKITSTATSTFTRNERALTLFSMPKQQIITRTAEKSLNCKSKNINNLKTIIQTLNRTYLGNQRAIKKKKFDDERKLTPLEQNKRNKPLIF